MSNRKKSILIVDDEQDILEFLSYNPIWSIQPAMERKPLRWR